MDGALLVERLRNWRFRVDVVVAAVVVILAVDPPVEVDRASPVVAILATVGILSRSVSPSVALIAVWFMAGSQMIVNERPGFAAIAILLVLYSAARLGTRVELAASAASVVIGGVIATNYLLAGTRYAIIAFSSSGWSVLALIAPTVVLAAAWLAGFAVRSFRGQRRESERRVIAEDRTERALSAAEAEKVRADMARDVHDIVGHSLAVIIAQADSVQFLDDVDRVRAVSATIADTARRSLHEVREVLSGTTPGETEDEPPDLDTLVEQIRAAGVTVERIVRGEQRPLDAAHSVVVRRVAQEMLTNALRHGDPGAPIGLREVWRSNDVVLEVENAATAGADGSGLGTGSGIAGMRLRLAAVGGDLEAEAVDGLFTTRARVPPPFGGRDGGDVIRIVLVDDQELFRGGVRVALDAQADMEVVGEAGDGREAVVLIDEVRPDVVLLDIRMPVMDGVETVRTLFDGSRTTLPRVIVLTTFALDRAAATAIRHGASGFVLKDATPAFLAAAIRAVHAGSTVLAADELGELFATDVLAAPAAPPPPAFRELSAREQAVFRLVARGLSNAEIAEREFVSESTVKTQVSSILAKLALRDRVQIVVFAHDHRLID
jgi:DNA-binding NarL/FixJ family response regulator/signal transduction histidine kinase